MKSRILVLSALAAALLVAGCSTSTPAVTATPTAAASDTNPYGAAAIDPLGPDEPVLVVSGGAAGEVALTLAELEALGTQTVTLYEPFVKKQQSFTGVPLAAVLDRAGVASDEQVDTLALNDYAYSDLASDFEASDAILATQRDGGPIPYDEGGPVRLVYPDGTPLAGNLDAWNWSLARVAVSPVSAG